MTGRFSFPHTTMIEVKRVTKSFGPKLAVDDVSFHVRTGEVLGFLGPNGAGKSTSMRMITGFIPPTSGTIMIDGKDISEAPVASKQIIGYLPENAPCYPDMTVEGFLRFSAEIRGLTGSDRSKAVDRALDMCFLQNVRGQSVDTLSKGYRHRTCFAQSIIHDPPILIMDEPTDGLDPNQKHEVRTLIREMGKTKAIIFSTHILEEVEAVCSRAIIIDRGRIVANGTPSELKSRSKKSKTLRTTVHGIPAQDLESLLAKIASVESVEVIETGANVEAVIRVADKAAHSDVLAEEVAAVVFSKKAKLRSLQWDEGRLDEVFRSITLPDTVPAKSTSHS